MSMTTTKSTKPTGPALAVKAIEELRESMGKKQWSYLTESDPEHAFEVLMVGFQMRQMLMPDDSMLAGMAAYAMLRYMADERAEANGEKAVVA